MKSAVKALIFLYVVVLNTLPAQAQQEKKLSTWNVEWLDMQGNERFKPSLRSKADFNKMSYYFHKLDTSVLTFQEVSSKSVIKKVVGSDYDIYLSDRNEQRYRYLQFNGINQYTGIAVKKGMTIHDPSDFSLLPEDRRDKLRFATYIVIEDWLKQPVHLLSIHLKAHCSGRYQSNNSCQTLKQQGEQLNRWIKQREKQNHTYVISGDFNHNLAYPNDWLWEHMTQDTQAKLATRNVQAKCKVRSRNNPGRTHQFRSLIDHMIVSDNLMIKNATQQVFTRDDVLNYQLSDHCPVSLTLDSF